MQTERQSFDNQRSQMLRDNEELLEQIRSQHRKEVAELTSEMGNCKSEKLLIERELKQMQNEYGQLQDRSTKDLQSLKATKESLENELNRTVEESDHIQQQLDELQKDYVQQKSNDTVEREKMQSLMDRLEANGAAVAQKQADLDERERVLKETGNDIEMRLNELIKLVRVNSYCWLWCMELYLDWNVFAVCC